MSRKRKLNEEISVDKIYDHFVANDFVEKVCDELYATFQEKGSYKYLKNIGLRQISTAAEWSGSLYEDIQKSTRMHYVKIKEVTSKIEEEMEQIIKEKFQGTFRNTLKEEIIKFISKPYSPAPKNGRKPPSHVIKPLTAENIAIKEEENNQISDLKILNVRSDCDAFLDSVSIGSLSSVHTSDLSSFDDEISISSDEETGRERKVVSLQFAREELDRCKANKVFEEFDAQDRKEKSSMSAVVIKSEDSASEGERSSPRRIRKPNLKYFSSDLLSPFDVDIEASGPTRAPLKNGASSVARKRGRPRKYPPP